MNEDKKNLLQAKLYLEYYKKDINDKYQIMLNNFALDNDILNNFNEMLWITTLDKYKQLKQENARLKEIENKLIFIKNRAKQGMSQENINKCAIELINSYLKEN